MTPRVIPHKQHRIEIDTASLRLGLAMPEPMAFGGEPQIAATPRDVQRSSGFISASMLALKCKQVDDRLYAAVEHAAQGGSSGKRELLLALGRRLAAQSLDGGAAPEVILAASALGGVAHRLEGTLGARVNQRINEFLADPLAEADRLLYRFRRAVGDLPARSACHPPPTSHLIPTPP